MRGGENLSMRAILQALARSSGLPVPRLEIPRRLAITAGMASDLVEGRLLRREPHVPLEAARMSATRMVFSDERARTEIGHTSRPAREAIEESARWFAGHGYVPADRRAAIRWQGQGRGPPTGRAGRPPGSRAHRNRPPRTA